MGQGRFGCSMLSCLQGNRRFGQPQRSLGVGVYFIPAPAQAAAEPQETGGAGQIPSLGEESRR